MKKSALIKTLANTKRHCKQFKPHLDGKRWFCGFKRQRAIENYPISINFKIDQMAITTYNRVNQIETTFIVLNVKVFSKAAVKVNL